MKTFSLFALFLTVFLSSYTTRVSHGDCSIMRSGVFLYDGGDDPVKVEIKDDIHTEYHNGGKYFIKSSIEWVSDCEYNATIKKVTIPDFPYKKGTTMNVKILHVHGNEIDLSCRVGEQTWKSKMIKQE